MARNKNPQETVRLILDVALQLFMQKGYEHTSVQDIIDNLGGLSKGAIYHHFKSKEDILIAATDQLCAESNQLLREIRNRTDLNGKEKLKMIFRESICRPVQEDLFSAAPNLGDNPRFILGMLQEMIEESAPDYIKPIIEQGMQDGSIQTEYPQELSELILLTMNFWLNPMIFHDSVDVVERKFRITQQMLRGFGLDVLEEELLQRLKALTRLYLKNR